MLFTAPAFVFVFMPVTLLVYFLTPARMRNSILLMISFLFYFWGEPWFIAIVIASALLDFAIGYRVAMHGRRVGAWLAFGIVANMALLVVFKYADFILSNAEPLVGSLPRLHLLLPLGLSFVVFEKITYLVDLYRNKNRPAASLRDYMLFVFLFPKMLAGPIIKYHEIEYSLTHRVSLWEDRSWGFLRFVWGLSKKVLIADVCGNVADAIFDQPAGSLGFMTAWIAVLAFTTQIYYDFSGYSDMAIGLARIFGFKLRENFNHPYGSRSFTEFWRCWHISLSSWIRDYLYVPLGGNRRSKTSTLVNLWTCFLLSGLWHGASWHFVLWGAWNGIFLLLDKLFWLRMVDRLPRTISVAATLLFLMVGWIIFRADSMAKLGEMIVAIMSPGLTGRFVWVRLDQVAAICIGLGGALIASTGRVRTLVDRGSTMPGGRAGAAILIVSIGLFATAKLVTVTFQPFLYFRF
jgi:alginate O-acetyltransferase complex protein AlgI